MEFTWDRFCEYYTTRVFGLTGAVDMLVFIFAILIAFYSVAGPSKRAKTLGQVIWKNVLWVVIHAAGMYAVWLLVGGFLYVLTDQDLVINYVPKLLIIVLYVIFFSKEGGRARIISAATLLVLDIAIVEVGGSLTGVLNSFDTSTTEEYFRAGITCLTLVVAVVLRVWNIDRYKDIPWVAVVAVLAYSVIGLVIALLRAQFREFFGAFEGTDEYEYSYYIQLYATITIAVVVLYNLICYFLVYNILKIYERNKVLNKNLAQAEQRETLETLNEDNLKQMRAIRHDLKNRFAIMQSMLDNEQYDDLKKYFHDVDQEAIVPLSQVNTGNQALDIVLNLEISKAVAYGIKIDSKVVVPPSLPMSDLDMDRLISNILDNAIEACQKISKDERSIAVTIQTVYDYLVIEVSNSMNPARAATALSLETDKPDKKMHGLGSKIIDSVVTKYGGQINRSIVDGRFVVKVMMELDASGQKAGQKA